MQIYQSIGATIGRTPLVRLKHMGIDPETEVLAKLEYFNPLGSVKDRIAAYMIAAATR